MLIGGNCEDFYFYLIWLINGYFSSLWVFIVVFNSLTPESLVFISSVNSDLDIMLMSLCSVKLTALNHSLVMMNVPYLDCQTLR